MPETVLVTGGTGFVAGWCITELLERGYAVRATVRSLSREATLRSTIDGDGLSVVAADLTSDAGWDAAMAGCDHVLHVASPLGGDNPKNPDELIVPARDGTLRVLRAATRAGVKRVVMTSSCAAATPPPDTTGGVFDETTWTDVTDRTLNAYRKSKAISERAAWDLMDTHDGPTTLTTILPGAVFGPVLNADNLGSVQVISRLLRGMPGVPRIGLNIVDVRDLADLHLRAMTTPDAAGHRFIAVSDFMWMSEVAHHLRATLGPRASKVPTRTLPDLALRAMSLIDPSVRAITPMLGRKYVHTSAKAQRLLDWHPRPATTTVTNCAESLLTHAAVPASPSRKGRG